jgi:hypothetical protein
VQDALDDLHAGEEELVAAQAATGGEEDEASQAAVAAAEKLVAERQGYLRETTAQQEVRVGGV